jgi:hypothetical protein
LGDGAVMVTWELKRGQVLTLDANLSGRTASGFAPAAGRVLWQEGQLVDGAAYGVAGPWFVRWSIA